MLYDCFIFNDELDMLECRLEELVDVVDKFVIVEAWRTFQGARKPWHYQLNQKRFERWWPKLHVTSLSDLSGGTTWEREAFQRDALVASLTLLGIGPDDWVLLSDVDEIPHPDAIRLLESGLAPAAPIVVFEQRFHPFAVDWRHPRDWNGTLAARFRHVPQSEDGLPSMSLLRAQRDLVPVVQDAGWHLSWVGSTASNVDKLAAFSHVELVAELTDKIATGYHHLVGEHVDGEPLQAVTVDASWPSFVRRGAAPKSWFRPESDFKQQEQSVMWTAEHWKIVSEATGWLSEEEARALFSYANLFPGPGWIVELGAYCGRSAVAMGLGISKRLPYQGDAKLWSVDLWTDRKHLAAYALAVSAAGVGELVRTIQSDTAEAARHFRPGAFPVQLLFIDGDHSYGGARRDFEAWSPHLAEDGVVAFHDDWAPGPRQVIAELPGWYERIDQAGSITFLRKRAVP